MKSPDDARPALLRQWRSNQTRKTRLLDGGDAWPVVVGIPKPKPGEIATAWSRVRSHLDSWRGVTIGRVEWEPTSYRAASEPIEVPVRWVLATPSEWIGAIDQPAVSDEFQRLGRLVEVSHPRYRSFLVERHSLLGKSDPADVEAALDLAERLSEGCANGLPLRALPIGGVDTKFFERNAPLLTALLDIRFDGAVAGPGLEAFLGAAGGDGHWLLVADLDGELLPYRRMRLTDTDVAEAGVPGSRLVVVENERCLHALPPSPDTIAILGAGLNLRWLSSAALADHAVAYWGDLDTWGLVMLSRARAARPDLTALLMDEPTFDHHHARAVAEPNPASEPDRLVDDERRLFARLASTERGRLEQEFLPRDLVRSAVRSWLASPQSRAGERRPAASDLGPSDQCRPDPPPGPGAVSSHCVRRGSST